ADDEGNCVVAQTVYLCGSGEALSECTAEALTKAAEFKVEVDVPSDAHIYVLHAEAKKHISVTRYVVPKGKTTLPAEGWFTGGKKVEFTVIAHSVAVPEFDALVDAEFGKWAEAKRQVTAAFERYVGQHGACLVPVQEVEEER